MPHIANKNYKAFLKLLLKLSVEGLSSEDTKEIENAVGTLRADKLKAEKAAAAAKKGGEHHAICLFVCTLSGKVIFSKHRCEAWALQRLHT